MINPKISEYERNYDKNNMKKLIDQEARNDLRILDKFDYLHDKISSPFHKQFLKRCLSIEKWWVRYTNYTRTCALWSIIGYYIGLGDRHLENILVTKHFKLVHIDF